MISTFASTINLMLMSRATAEYIIGFVCSYTLNLISIELEHEWSYVMRNFFLLNYSIQVIKSIYGRLNSEVEVVFNLLQNSFNANIP